MSDRRVYLVAREIIEQLRTMPVTEMSVVLSIVQAQMIHDLNTDGDEARVRKMMAGMSETVLSNWQKIHGKGKLHS